ncbi:MAG: hypothetical protein J6Y10_05355 [Lachnospiraceae bacterium]|nr:hypothetical protein [Lachnospiraceae bacterium]
MGYSEDFLCVKQFDRLYEVCMAAGQAFEEGERNAIFENVTKGFDEMKRILEDKAGTNAYALLGPDSDFLSELSKRNYTMYCSSETKVEDSWDILVSGNDESARDSNAANNAFYALQEEVSKFAQYYVRGARPNSIAEIDSEAHDGYHLDRNARGLSDIAFAVIFAGGMFLTGIVFLMISLFSQRSDLTITGLVFMVFAVILVALRFVKK